MHTTRLVRPSRGALNATPEQVASIWQALAAAEPTEGHFTVTLYSVHHAENLFNDQVFMRGYQGAERPPIGQVEHGHRKYSELWGSNEQPGEGVFTDDALPLVEWLGIATDDWEA